MSEEELLNAISLKSGLNREAVLARIAEKEVELAGLISRLGAAYIVGKDLGVDLVQPMAKELKIKNIVSDMRSVTFVGKIVEVGKVREFDTSDGKGKVLNVVLGDETGTIRLSLWDDKATEAVDGLKAGQVWQVVGAYTRRDPYGNAEVRLGKWGNLKKVDVDIQVAPQKPRARGGRGEYKPTTLREVAEDDFVEVTATLLSISERRAAHRFCSVCRVKLEGEICPAHKEAKPENVLIVSGVIDDGYGSMGAVFFRDAAEGVLGVTTDEAAKRIRELGDRAFYESLSVQGESFRIWGLIKRNKVTGALELVAHRLKRLVPKEELTKLMSTVE